VCADFGLNVHGKALYFFIESATSLRVVTDRSVYGRLVRLAASRYAAWLDRRVAGADRTTVAASGTVAASAADGAFDLTVSGPGGGRLAVLVRTGAGEATVVEVPVPARAAADAAPAGG
jgi:hypothetical protein